MRGDFIAFRRRDKPNFPSISSCLGVMSHITHTAEFLWLAFYKVLPVYFSGNRIRFMDLNDPGAGKPLIAHKRNFLIAARIFGFAIGAMATVFSIYIVFLSIELVSGHRFIPRGVGLVTFPILIGIMCSQFIVKIIVLPPYCLWIERFFRSFIDTREGRLYIAGTGTWFFCVLAYSLFGGFYRSFTGVEWDALFTWLFMPPIAGAVGVRLFVWAKQPIH